MLFNTAIELKDLVPFGSAFFGAVAAYMLARKKDALEKISEQRKSILNFFHVNEITLSSLLNHKINHLYFHDDIAEEVTSFCEKIVYERQKCQISSMRDEFYNILWVKVETTRKSEFGSLGIFSERWEKILFPINDINKIVFVAENYSSIMHIHLQLISSLSAIDSEIAARDRLWNEFQQRGQKVTTDDEFVVFIICMYRLLLTRKSLIEITDRAIVLSLSVGALTEDLLLNKFKDKSVSKVQQEIIDLNLIPQLDRFKNFIGKDSYLPIVEYFKQRHFKKRTGVS